MQSLEKPAFLLWRKMWKIFRFSTDFLRKKAICGFQQF